MANGWERKFKDPQSLAEGSFHHELSLINYPENLEMITSRAIKYYSVVVTQNPIRGYCCYVTLHTASPVQQGQIFQVGGSGNIHEVFTSAKTGRQHLFLPVN